MRWVTVLVAAAMLLSGCASTGGGADEDDIEDLFEDTPQAASGKGLIRGVVVDPSLTPVVGAVVGLGGTTVNETSDDNGAFVFLDLEPGTYFVQVSKAGWTTVQQSTEVVADVPEPPILKVAIERVPGSDPRAVTLSQDGFVSCSVGTPTTFFDCNTIEEQRARLHFDVEGVPRWVQTEILWDSTQPVGDWFYVIQGFCTCDGDIPDLDGARFNETAEARSPHVARADPDFLASHDVGTSEDVAQLVIDVSASGPEPDTTNGSGVALNQQFTTYATFFYNIDPDPAWTFVADGPYPVPPPA